MPVPPKVSVELKLDFPVNNLTVLQLHLAHLLKTNNHKLVSEVKR